jgi:stage II sporulation protein M
MEIIDIRKDPFSDKKYHGFFGIFRRGRVLYKKYLRKPMRLVLILFFGIAIASAIFFYIYRDHAMNIISQFLSELSGTGVIDDESNISVVGLWANNVRAASNAWLFGLVPFIYLPVLSVIINAGMMGILTGYIGATTGASFFSSALVSLIGVIPHGIFELTALFLCMSMGIALCTYINRRILKKYEPWTFDIFMQEMAIYFATRIIPLLTVAAVVEVYVTPLVLGAFGA